MKTLKDLQSLMGTMNYVRPHAGPAFARIAAPIPILLKPGAEFPPSPELQEVLNKLKLLFTCDAVLRVADDRAALDAANAWIAGDEPQGRPFEAGADTSKIAWGGVVGQCDENNEALLAAVRLGVFSSA